MVLDFREDKGFLCLDKKAIDRRQEWPFGTPVRDQRKRSVRYFGRFEISEDIGSAESVDRLLRITNEEKTVILEAEDGSKDLVLCWIGILKLIDQSRRVFLGDGSD